MIVLPNIINRKRPHSEIASMDQDHSGIMMHHQPSKPLSSSITLPIDSKTLLDSDITGIVSQILEQTNAASASVASSPSSSTSSTTSSSSTSTTNVHVPKRMDNKNTISSPQDFFTGMLQARGYPGTTFSSLKCGYHNSPTNHQTISYGVSLTKAIRSSDIPTARSLLACGLHPNACNKFGESIVHAACRRGDYEMLRALIDAQSSVQVTDDFGRTPMHDACWTSSPNFDTIRLLLDQDPWLISIMDCRGSTPLGYVRKAHWAIWNGFLGSIADCYWPSLLNEQGEVSDQETNDKRLKAPPLAFLEPNSRPLPELKENVRSLEVIELLANGKLTPQDLDIKGNSLEPSETFQEIESAGCRTAPLCSRITLDPMRQNGSNATTMMKKSLSADPLKQGYLQVSVSSQQVLDYIDRT
mmetsp:Transcript_20605/g.44762  ORF Transcript_20605/g.44762 Transcript_20605/m.44762 type:complete len:414 (+) Transcript_20605:318-1559(+)